MNGIGGMPVGGTGGNGTDELLVGGCGGGMDIGGGGIPDGGGLVIGPPDGTTFKMKKLRLA